MTFRYDKVEEKLIISEATRIEYHQIKIWVTRKVKGWRFLPAVKMGLWDGNQTYFNNGSVNLGLWKECYKACKEIGVMFNIENRDDFPINRDVTLDKVNDFCKEFFKDHKVKDKDGNWIKFFPYDYQIETAYKILKNRFSLASVATSGGKSLIISIVYFYTLKYVDPSSKLLLICPSINLITQFYDSIIDFNNGENADYDGGNKNRFDIRIEEIMSDHPRKHSSTEDPNVYIGTYQSLEKRDKKFFEQFHTVACDEAHQAKAASLKSILTKTFKHAYNRFGVSGTFPEDDSLEILSIQAVLGPIITEISADSLVKEGTITPMNIKAVILNHNEKEISDRISYSKKQGGGKEVFQFEKDFIQQSEKRLDFIKKIVEKCDNNTLVLFHTIEYGQKILEKLKSELPDREFYYIDGSVNNKERNFIKTQMEKPGGKIKILIASYGTMGTGISIKNLHFLIMADSFKSKQIVIQAIGRLLRLFDGKLSATIFDLVDVFSSDMNNILYSHWLERERMYKKGKYPYKIIKANL